MIARSSPRAREDRPTHSSCCRAAAAAQVARARGRPRQTCPCLLWTAPRTGDSRKKNSGDSAQLAGPRRSSVAGSQQQKHTTRHILPGIFTLQAPSGSSAPPGTSCPGLHADAHCFMFITKLNYLTKLLIQNCMFLNSEYSNFMNLGLVKIARS